METKGSIGIKGNNSDALTKTMRKNDTRLGTLAIEDLEKRVNDLYQFRDNYFQSHPLKDAEKKWVDVEGELEKVTKAFGDMKKMDSKEGAAYLYLLGRALNVVPEYRPESEEVLTKAVKLDSKLYRAWNELGETYCKKNWLDEARKCYLAALEQENNKESLRNLSILMRTKEFWNLKNGLTYAKEAVELDPKDGKSWLVLGNAYSCLYSVKQDSKILEMCEKAYGIAEKDERLKREPCLYYNRGVVGKMRNDYGGALSSFEKAESLDPTWREPRMEKAKLLEYLDKAQSFVSDKGKLEGKKVKKLLRTVTLRVFPGKNRKVKCVCLSDLRKEENKGKVVVGVVAATFPEESRFNLVLVDVQQSSAIVNVYNLPEEGSVRVGSIVAVPDPVLSKVRITGNGRNYEFDTIRVENPSAMTVDGKVVDSKKTSIHFSATSLPD